MDGSAILTREPAPAALSVAPVDRVSRADWRGFVRDHPDGSPFHLPEWSEAIAEALGYDTPGLVAQRAGEIVGVLPLTHVRTLMFGNALISTGFSVGGGVLAADPDAARALAEAAAAMADERGVDYLELRGRAAAVDGWPVKDDVYAGFRQPLDPDAEARLKAIPRKKRADIRKGLAAGFRVDAQAPLETFHALYARNLHALGTPILPRRWYAALKRRFGESCELSAVHDPQSGAPVVALMSFYFRDQVLPYYVGARPEARKLHAFDHVYWDLMARAAAHGVRVFDFGRSKTGTGAFAYKKHWGFTPEPLAYQYHLTRARSVPDVNPNNPKYRRFVEGWKRAPFAATRLVGPFLARQLG